METKSFVGNDRVQLIDKDDKEGMTRINEGLRLYYEGQYLERWILESVKTKLPSNFKEI
jgi:hypothetical protein